MIAAGCCPICCIQVDEEPELKGLGIAVSATTVRTWLRTEGLGPAGQRREMTWRDFVRVHRQSLLAVDFFTVETIWLERLYALFFIELGNAACIWPGARRIRVPNGSSNRRGTLSWGSADRSDPIRFLIRDRDRNDPQLLVAAAAESGHQPEPSLIFQLVLAMRCTTSSSFWATRRSRPPKGSCLEDRSDSLLLARDALAENQLRIS